MITHPSAHTQTQSLATDSLLQSEESFDQMNEEAYARDPRPAICDPEQELLLACREVIESWENGNDMQHAVQCCQVAIQLGECQRTLVG